MHPHQTLPSGSNPPGWSPASSPCLRCSTALPHDAQFCPTCGTARQFQPQAPTSGLPLPAAARPRGNLGLIVALAVLVASILGSGIALVLAQPGKDPAVAALHSNATATVAELVGLDNDLDEGMSFVEYSVLLDRGDKAFTDLDELTPARLDNHPAMVAINAALAEYRDAKSAWQTNIDCTYCESDEVEPTLQSHWSTASDDIDEARGALEAK